MICLLVYVCIYACLAVPYLLQSVFVPSSCRTSAPPAAWPLHFGEAAQPLWSTGLSGLEGSWRATASS